MALTEAQRAWLESLSPEEQQRILDIPDPTPMERGRARAKKRAGRTDGPGGYSLPDPDATGPGGYRLPKGGSR